MRFHLVGLPHTQSTAEYSNCAFNSLLRGQATILKSLGHEVIVYSSEDNDAPCDEHVELISKNRQAAMFDIRGPEDILKSPLDQIMYNHDQPWWGIWNGLAMEAVGERRQQHDFLCIIGGGTLFDPLIQMARKLGMMPVEYAVGYAGVHPDTWHCYGANSWRHLVWGMNPTHGWGGRWYDRTIPHYFNPDDFEYRTEKADYFLYLGKIKEDKGVNIAARACKAAGVPLVVAGQGPTPVEYGEVRQHYVGPLERRELLAGARGLFVPSTYVEPFGMVAVEALLSGTPIVTSPFGGLGEINEDGMTGYVCHNLQDFVDAAKRIDGGHISSAYCRVEGARYTYDRVAPAYQKWYTDLYGLWSEGWGELRD